MPPMKTAAATQLSRVLTVPRNPPDSMPFGQDEQQQRRDHRQDRPLGAPDEHPPVLLLAVDDAFATRQQPVGVSHRGRSLLGQARGWARR